MTFWLPHKQISRGQFSDGMFSQSTTDCNSQEALVCVHTAPWGSSPAGCYLSTTDCTSQEALVCMQTAPWRCALCCLGFNNPLALAIHSGSEEHNDFARRIAASFFGAASIPRSHLTEQHLKKEEVSSFQQYGGHHRSNTISCI